MCVFFYEDTTGILNFRVRACSARDVSYYNDDDDDDDDDNDDEMMTILFTLSFRFPILSSSLVAFFYRFCFHCSFNADNSSATSVNLAFTFSKWPAGEFSFSLASLPIWISK